jgi:hypothetical protein
MSKSFLQTAIDDGRLVLWHSYRSGSFVDKSGNGRNGTPTDVNFTGDGIQVLSSTGNVSVDDDAALQLTTGCIVSFGPIYFPDATVRRMVSKRDSGGTNYEFRGVSDSLRFFDGTSVRTLAVSNLDLKLYRAVNFQSGSTPVGFVEGVNAGNFSGSVAPVKNDAPISIGNINPSIGSGSNVIGNLGDILIFNAELTETEHAQLYSELSGMAWNKHPYITSFANLRVDPNEPGLVAGYDMIPVGGTLPDVAGVNDGAINGAWFEETVMGPSMAFDGVGDNIEIPYTVSTSANTFSLWFSPKDVSSFTQGIFTTGNNPLESGPYLLLQNNNGSLRTYNVGVGYSTTIETLNSGNMYNIVITRSQSEEKVYVNGQLKLTRAMGITGNKNSIYLGSGFNRNSNVKFYGGFAVYSDIKDQPWVTQQYNKGKTALWKTGYGVNESVSAVTGGPLENSPFYVEYGAFNISSDTIDGNDVKVIECTSPGVCYVPTSYFSQTATEAAFGGWRFWVKKADASTIVIVNIASVVGTATNGNNYNLIYNNGESINFRRNLVTIIGGGATVYPANAWQLFEIKRDSSKKFRLFANGNSIGTATDANFLISNFMNFDIDAGDKIALDDPTGKYSIIKSVLP